KSIYGSILKYTAIALPLCTPCSLWQTQLRQLDSIRITVENHLMADSTATKHVPDTAGRFGQFGGRYVPETLIRALDELAIEYDKACQDAAFQSELSELLKNYV